MSLTDLDLADGVAPALTTFASSGSGGSALVMVGRGESVGYFGSAEPFGPGAVTRDSGPGHVETFISGDGGLEGTSLGVSGTISSEGAPMPVYAYGAAIAPDFWLQLAVTRNTQLTLSFDAENWVQGSGVPIADYSEWGYASAWVDLYIQQDDWEAGRREYWGYATTAPGYPQRVVEHVVLSLRSFDQPTTVLLAMSTSISLSAGNVPQIPEPPIWALFAAGFVVLSGRRRQLRAQQLQPAVPQRHQT
ncbi:hypothetical protein CKO43_07635 [Rubrivivax gelatinosus]|uniref:PEP-CTERM sorting domain-containing protein n=2 Tax=Rubrivivax gelatinosus TaxID=28068 RepID=A0ABS1DSP5_RUBGE|nr:hypothetical protein [Rubrivivax gelatinosus]